MDNAIDIINDILTVESDFTAATYDASSKAFASQVFDKQGYLAAGVLCVDRSYWDIITEVMASFLGSAYFNGSGDMVLEIDDGTIASTGATIIPMGDVKIIDIKQRLENLINQCPCSYSYLYGDNEFGNETDDTAHASLASQGIYGLCKPDEAYSFYWCRDVDSIHTMQDIIVGKFARPVYEIEFEDLSMKRLGLDVGDIFAMTVDSLYDDKGGPLHNQFWKVVSVSPNFTKGTIRFRAIQTASYMTNGGIRDITVY
jgi:hypothetical protein